MSSKTPNSQAVTIPDLSSDENDLVNGLLGELHSRRQRNLLRTSYYDSKRAIRRVGTIVPPQYYNLGLVLGWVGKGVDALARRINLDTFTWAAGELTDIGGDLLWDNNDFGSEIDGAVIAALQHGPAFLINTAGEDDEPQSLIHVKDATEATGEWNRRRRHLDNLLSVIDRDKDGRPTQLALYLDGETVTAVRADGRWSVERDDHEYGVPVEVLPYQHSPKRPFGRSRITRPMMGLQDAGTRALIRREGHMDVFSYPELWMLGADESIFRNASGEQKSMWEIRLGRIKGIPDDDEAMTPRADVKQFPAASPEPHWGDINGLAKLFAREAQLPDTALAIKEMANPTSAESYDASQYELIGEAEGAISDFRAGLRRSFVRGLAIQNEIPMDEIPETWKSIDPVFRDPRYQSKAAQADAGTKQLSAVPWLAETEVGLQLLGLTPQQVRAALAERRRQQGGTVLDRLRAAAGQQDQQVVTGDAAV